MSLVQILAVLALIGASTCCSLLLGNRFGAHGYLAGVAIGPSAIVGAYFLLSGLARFLWFGIPTIPTCPICNTNSDDYEAVQVPQIHIAWRCKCGELFHKQGRRFYRSNATGDLSPHLKWVPILGWVSDTRSIPPSA